MIVKAKEIGADLLLRDVEYFDPDQTFDCGQCFRFRKIADLWTGVAMGRILSVRRVGDTDFLLVGCTAAEFEKIWRNYLGFTDDYAAIRTEIAERFPDRHLVDAMEAGKGIRLLRQESWEATASFVISQNNNIVRIRRMIDALCLRCGREIADGIHAFPEPSAVCALSEAELRSLGMGYRAPYLRELAEGVASGRLVLEDIGHLPTAEAADALMGVRGIGAKVAACALLFGFRKDDAFPVDRWIRRVLESYYPEAGPDYSNLFGSHAGLCQQYLFYYEYARKKG